ncbi:MAG: AAA family ATPase [Deltaproteobacteria bacterium]|nr:AAA family ATPase [Deltaproteobacteria bacterium]
MNENINRTLAGVVKEASKSFKVVLLTGPRQVGKTTLLQDIQGHERSYVTLDDLQLPNGTGRDN